MADLFADEDVPFGLQRVLRRLGYNVQTVRDFCQNPRGDGWGDLEVLRFARERGWVTITCNADDFQALHHQCPWHTGIIIIKAYEGDGEKAHGRRLDDLIRGVQDFRSHLLDGRPSAIRPAPRKHKRARGG